MLNLPIILPSLAPPSPVLMSRQICHEICKDEMDEFEYFGTEYYHEVRSPDAPLPAHFPKQMHFLAIRTLIPARPAI